MEKSAFVMIVLRAPAPKRPSLAPRESKPKIVLKSYAILESLGTTRSDFGQQKFFRTIQGKGRSSRNMADLRKSEPQNIKKTIIEIKSPQRPR